VSEIGNLRVSNHAVSPTYLAMADPNHDKTVINLSLGIPAIQQNLYITSHMKRKEFKPD